MKQYKVTGMGCAACSARVEKAVSNTEGVTACSVNLLTASMEVEGNVSPDKIIAVVTEAGYGAELVEDEEEPASESEEDLSNNGRYAARLISSICLLVVLMYISMGHMMWDFPIPGFLSHNHMTLGIVQMVLTIIIMVINRKFFINGIGMLIKLSPNMDTLVAIGAGAAFLYSTIALFAGAGMEELYFESAGTILTLITVGKALEDKSKGRTTDALKGLMKLTPATANVISDGEEITVSVNQIKVGDVYVVRPGESIPVDGVVIEGDSAVNEAALTGESIPADKKQGEKVYSGTINLSGFLRCRAESVGKDTTLSKIIKMVKDASSSKAPIAKIADKVSGVFVPVVMAIAVITTIIWLILGYGIGYSLARGISVLVISCPCALGLATPVAIMVGNGVGAKKGILFKTATALEITGKAKYVVLDKTGTITVGEPSVTDVCIYKSDEGSLLNILYSLENKSEHPIAKALVRYAMEKGAVLSETEEFMAHSGSGVSGVYRGQKVVCGNHDFVSDYINLGEADIRRAESLSMEGKTPLYVVADGELLGIVAVADSIKEDSADAILELKKMGMKVIMLTGDNPVTAEAVGRKCMVDEVIAGVMPGDKESVIKELSENGRVIMVGDGINDAPALTRADTGMAIGSGTDIAIDAADVVLVKNSLKDVVRAVRLSRATIRNIHQNLFWAFIYNVIGIPLAAGCFIALFGWELNPMFGAAAMSLSSVCVVTNALRLNLIKLH